ncbi:MAG TPA: secondary thiamine-phosphate synthase enzyme YjbQ [Thermotogota bacterium]|nr:secondary thiamine-phosphate synthase enzyme YjbQ [Thermotogota bacterium]HRW33891.1 secondary thiamine-phosphate synthase enzyme YjbQ [Thermotogota bacterium]
MKHLEIKIKTTARTQIVDITSHIQKLIQEHSFMNGLVFVFVPHTTAGVSINENADPDVKRDFLDKMTMMVPADTAYRHVEGNADAHIKTILTNTSQTLFVEDGQLILGTWQGIYFCEYDGPRTRKCWIKFME